MGRMPEHAMQDEAGPGRSGLESPRGMLNNSEFTLPGGSAPRPPARFTHHA